MVRSLCVSALEVRDRHEMPIPPPTPVPAPPHVNARSTTTTLSGSSAQKPRSTNGSNAIVKGGPSNASPGPSNSPLKRKSTLLGATLDDSDHTSPMKKHKLDAGANGQQQSTAESPVEMTSSSATPKQAHQTLATSSSTIPGPNHAPQSHSHIQSQNQAQSIQLRRQNTSMSHSHSHARTHEHDHRRSAPIPLFAPPPSARQPLRPAHVLEAYAAIQRQQAASRVGGMRNFRGGIGKGRMPLI